MASSARVSMIASIRVWLTVELSQRGHDLTDSSVRVGRVVPVRYSCRVSVLTRPQLQAELTSKPDCRGYRAQHLSREDAVRIRFVSFFPPSPAPLDHLEQELLAWDPCSAYRDPSRINAHPIMHLQDGWLRRTGRARHARVETLVEVFLVDDLE